MRSNWALPGKSLTLLSTAHTGQHRGPVSGEEMDRSDERPYHGVKWVVVSSLPAANVPRDPTWTRVSLDKRAGGPFLAMAPPHTWPATHGLVTLTLIPPLASAGGPHEPYVGPGRKQAAGWKR